MILALLGQGGVSALSILAPHPVAPPPPVVPVVAPAPKVVMKAPAIYTPTTTTTTVPVTTTGLECVVTMTDSLGNTMTYSPGPAVGGACADGTPEPYTVTSGS